ncbi:MAG TPA: aldehyde ferredoxin oxidoreductase C-terminal domain-containing protein, partial [Nitrospirota bacterium]|nr:aldehyde ferredoxin oxidoreductase C-terminal domain-containing protein [Nitrospirota bacterium]
LVTGDKKSREELDIVAERIFLLHRALTIRGMGTKQMRTKHDMVPDWAFHDSSGKAPFTKGTLHMDKKDATMAVDMFYDEMGWDRATGTPTLQTYRKFGLQKVAEDLGIKQLLAETASKKPNNIG